jgi:hypothetical protein
MMKKSTSTKLPVTLVGVSGEYFVAAELSRRGYVASITLRNTRGVDILATNSKTTKHVSIQVKTNTTGKRSWILSEKAETETSKSHYYVFVNLTECGQMPEYFILPSKVVADFVRKGHRYFLATKDRQGKNHKDTPMRQFQNPDDKYRDNWKLLGL